LKKRFNLNGARPVRRGFVLTGGPIDRTHTDGLLLVGDTAGQTKATTGGGVILGGLCAIKAGEVAAEAVETGDVSTGFLSSYEAWWKRRLGMEFSTMATVRHLLDGLSDERLDRLFAVSREEGLESVVERLVEEGDMDLQRGVIVRALRDPRVRRVLLRVLGRWVLGEFRGL